MKPVCGVTGATGYVGSRLAATLATQFEVVALGRHAGPGGISWSLANSSNLTTALRTRGVETLVHAAWDFGHPRARENWRINVEGSQRLLEEVRDAGVKRVVFISTISAFPGARSDYGRSKLAVEELVLRGGDTVLRPGLVWGERPGGMFGSLREQGKRGGLCHSSATDTIRSISYMKTIWQTALCARP